MDKKSFYSVYNNIDHSLSEPVLYKSDDNETVKRECCYSPNGNWLENAWVYRDANGKFIDFDYYRNDLADRNDIILN